MSIAPFLLAASGHHGAHTPVWFMRQAGRSLPEYRAKRGEGSILDAIKQPDLAAELTLQPVRRYGVDAAVLYSDIIVPAHAVGFGIDVAPGTGPVCQSPLRTAADVTRLRPFDPPADAPYVLQAVDILAAELPESVPLLAFAGAPFTVASYLIEGRPSRTYEHTKRLMHTEPVLWHQLMDRLVQHATASIASQLDPSQQAPRDSLRRLRQDVRRSVREARESIMELRSTRLERRDLAEALRDLAARTKSTEGVQLAVAVEVSGQPRRCSAETEEELLRIGQEAVSNAVRHAFEVIQPARIALVEAEVWPNWMAVAVRRKVPVHLVNARLSPRSEARFRRFRAFVAPVFRQLAWISVPESADLARWQAIGLPAEKLHCLGSIKFDDTPESQESPRTAEFRTLLATAFPADSENRKFLLAGSTHANEELLLAHLLLALRPRFPRLRLLIAPLHVVGVRELSSRPPQRDPIGRDADVGAHDDDAGGFVDDDLGRLVGFDAQLLDVRQEADDVAFVMVGHADADRAGVVEVRDLGTDERVDGVADATSGRQVGVA
jgi:hypothetical protein